MDFNQVNFRILTAPVNLMIQGTACDKLSTVEKALSFIKRPKSHKWKKNYNIFIYIYTNK